ncbi:MAG TPA: hypothetical protein VF699_05695 [Caulobacteraceae bacterium]
MNSASVTLPSLFPSRSRKIWRRSGRAWLVVAARTPMDSAALAASAAGRAMRDFNMDRRSGEVRDAGCAR